jgi:hypothetical protein
MRKGLLIGIVACALLLAGCSYRCEFVIVNHSASPILVEYTLKGPFHSGDVNEPAKLTLEEFKKAEHPWREVPKDLYQLDKSTASFTLSVEPGEALLVQRGSNCGGREYDQFNIALIKVTGEHGTILANDHQALSQFKSEDSYKYVLRYW